MLNGLEDVVLLPLQVLRQAEASRRHRAALAPGPLGLRELGDDRLGGRHVLFGTFQSVEPRVSTVTTPPISLSPCGLNPFEAREADEVRPRPRPAVCGLGLREASLGFTVRGPPAKEGGGGGSVRAGNVACEGARVAVVRFEEHAGGLAVLGAGLSW